MGYSRGVEHRGVGLCAGGWLVSVVALAADVALPRADHAAVCRGAQLGYVGLAAQQAGACLAISLGQVLRRLVTHADCFAALRGALLRCGIYGGAYGEPRCGGVCRSVHRTDTVERRLSRYRLIGCHAQPQSDSVLHPRRVGLLRALLGALARPLSQPCARRD